MKQELKHLQALVAVALCVILSFTFSSCSDDDDEPESKSIVGTWLLTEPLADHEWMWTQMIFHSNGIVDYKEWTSSDPEREESSGEWSISKDMLTIIWHYEDSDDITDMYQFSISGDKLTLNFKDWDEYVSLVYERQ